MYAHITQSRGNLFSVCELIGRTKTHGSAKIQKNMEIEFGLCVECPHDRFPQAGIKIPIDRAYIITKVVGSVVGEFLAVSPGLARSPP